MKRRVTRRGAGAALALVVSALGLAPVGGWAREIEMGDGTGGHLTPRSSLRDLLNHPAFAGFGDLLLPWDDRAYDGTLPLTDIGSLLPYHSHVDPETVTGALNRMIDDVGDGKTVFYRFYTEAQRREQPARERTGLFYFRGRPGAPFAVICPGGGFSYVGSVHEGFPYAAEISRRGYNAFVLRYRAGHGGTVATQDLAAALSYIFANAKALGVSSSVDLELVTMSTREIDVVDVIRKIHEQRLTQVKAGGPENFSGSPIARFAACASDTRTSARRRALSHPGRTDRPGDRERLASRKLNEAQWSVH